MIVKGKKFFCYFISYQLCRRKMKVGKRAKATLVVTISLILLGIIGYHMEILYFYPIQDLALTDINWTKEWLYAATLDYFVVLLCFSCIVSLNESLLQASLWILAFVGLGSPGCCLYVLYRFCLLTSS